MIEDDFQMENTRTKIRRLEALYARSQARPIAPNGEFARKLTLQSLRQTINRFTEEIIRYECQRKSGAKV